MIMIIKISIIIEISIIIVTNFIIITKTIQKNYIEMVHLITIDPIVKILEIIKGIVIITIEISMVFKGKTM